MAEMEVWDESHPDRRSEPGRRSRIRRFNDWKDYARFVAEITGSAVIVLAFFGALLTSMGFRFSGAGEAIAKIQTADIARDSSIAQLKSSQRPVMYMVCVLFAEQHPRQVPSECGNAVRESHPQ